MRRLTVTAQPSGTTLNTREFFMFQLTVNGLSGQVVVKHAVQDSRQDLFWFKQKMEAIIVQAQKVEDAT